MLIDLNQVLALALTIAQLLTQTPDKIPMRFDASSDQAKVTALLTQGCAAIPTQLSQGLAEDKKVTVTDLDNIFTGMMKELKAIQLRAKSGNNRRNDYESMDENVTPTVPEHEQRLLRLLEQVSVEELEAAYHWFCKGQIPSDSDRISLEKVITFYNASINDLPDPARLKNLKLKESSVVLDYNGERFTEIYSDSNRRKIVSIKSLPNYIKNAFVAAEDKRFYAHKGYDIQGIMRAGMSLVSAKGRPQGGSTITQQVVKNLLLENNNLKIERKIRELILSAKLEDALSKDEILELYLNYIYLGRASWGIEMAAYSYFKKRARELTIPEAAFLAGLTKGPNAYNPDRFLDRANERYRYVAKRMVEDNYLSEAQYKEVAAKPLTFTSFISPDIRSAKFFLNDLQQWVKSNSDLGSLSDESYVVRSTIHPELQKSAERALRDGLVDYEVGWKRTDPSNFKAGSIAELMKTVQVSWKEILPRIRSEYYDVHWQLALVIEIHPKTRAVKVGLPDGRVANLVNSGRTPITMNKLALHDLIYVDLVNPGQNRELVANPKVLPKVQGGVVVMEAKTGRILAMVGGFSYPKKQVNHTRTLRSPGSTLKPFIYLSALGLNYQPNSLVPNTPITLKVGTQYWSPGNYDKNQIGYNTTLQKALESSLNLPTVQLMAKLGQEEGFRPGLDFIRGVTERLDLYKKANPGPAFVLGSQETSLMDLATAYAAIANQGLMPKPYMIDSIEKNGRAVYEHPRDSLTQPLEGIVDRVAFYQLRRMLEGTISSGTAARRLSKLTGKVAAKTGTSQSFRDALFIALTNDLVVATWVGYDRVGVLGKGATGSEVALPIAEKILMDSFNVYHPAEPLAPPVPEVAAQIVEVRIDKNSGMPDPGGMPSPLRRSSNGSGNAMDTREALLKNEERYLPTGYAARSDEDAEDSEGPTPNLSMRNEDIVPGATYNMDGQRIDDRAGVRGRGAQPSYQQPYMPYQPGYTDPLQDRRYQSNPYNQYYNR